MTTIMKMPIDDVSGNASKVLYSLSTCPPATNPPAITAGRHSSQPIAAGYRCRSCSNPQSWLRLSEERMMTVRDRGLLHPHILFSFYAFPISPLSYRITESVYITKRVYFNSQCEGHSALIKCSIILNKSKRDNVPKVNIITKNQFGKFYCNRRKCKSKKVRRRNDSSK